MERRRFLQVAGVMGLALMAPVVAREVRAGSNKYKGPFWITLNAGGGWDPTMLCDPKGGTDPEDRAQVNHSYTPAERGQAGNILYAPTSYEQNGVALMTAAQFFGTHKDRLMILNGVDTTTNNHDGGSRNTWSGQLQEGFPSFAALAAAKAIEAQTIPLAYLSNGGYDSTQGVVSLTRVGSTDAVERLAFVNEMNPGDKNTGHYHTQSTASRIAAAQEGRLKAAIQKQRLPTVQRSMNALYMARQSDDGLQRLGEELKTLKLVNFPEDFPEIDGFGNVGSMEGLLRQAQLALLAFRSGVAVSANLSMGGYDTHNDSDDQQSRQLMVLCFTLDYLFKQIDALGLSDQVHILVGSDFGRTPYYNENSGKDHWNITSMMLAGPGIPGNTVIGATDDAFKPLTLNPKTLKVDASGVRLEPKHVHMSLRKLAGITGTELDKQYGIPGDPMPLFG